MINTDFCEQSYVASSSVDSYNIPFDFIMNPQTNTPGLLVAVDDVTQLFSVDWELDESGHWVVFKEPLTDGASILISRQTPFIQDSEYQLGRISHEQIEHDFDQSVMRDQELEARTSKLEGRMAVAEENIAELQVITEEHGEKLDEHEARLDNHETRIDALEEAQGISGKVDDVQLNGTSVVVDRIANIEPVAGDIAYTNSQFPTMATLQDAMDELLYVNPAVSVSGGGNYEIGSTRATTKLTWTWNKTIQSQSLNQGIGDLAPTVREYTYETEISSNTTFTVTGSDGKKTVSGSTSVNFLPKRYWGVSASPSLTDSGIIGLSSELSTSRTQTRTFDCSGGKYFYFAIKTSYCTNIKFKVGGLSFSDMDVETRQFTNASGHTDSYNIYRVHNLQTGAAILVEVS